MKRRRCCPVLASILLAVLLAAPVLAGGERRPKGESSGSGSRAQSSSPAPASPGNRPAPRTAVPRADQPQAQRQPQRSPDRTPRADGGRYSRYPSFAPPFYHPYYRWYPWGWWGGWYNPWWYYPSTGVYWYPEQVHQNMGALDLDISPEKAEVYLDGTLIGVADNFDGWPQKLWLEAGTYDLVFFHEGFETIARQYTIYAGLTIQVNDRMTPGEAKLPEELLAQGSANREERLRRRLERGEETAAPSAGTDRPDWRDRVRAEREQAARGEVAEEPAAFDARVEPARLRLAIQPADSAVYLDGRFLGTAEELLASRPGLLVDAGEHELEVVRPGYESELTAFTAEAGEEVKLTVELRRSE
jgi:hypothetical protein